DLHKVILPLVRGSDLIIEILNRCVNALDEITVIGGDQETISRLKERFNLQTIHHMNPSMGFDSKPAEIEEIVDFVVSKRSKFVIFSVGVPRQEMLCAQIFHNPEAVGTGICVGAGIEFAAGTKVRAPRWMQIAGLEWFFRLLKEPRRLGRRYLVEDMAIFPIF